MLVHNEKRYVGFVYVIFIYHNVVSVLFRYNADNGMNSEAICVFRNVIRPRIIFEYVFYVQFVCYSFKSLN